MTLELALRDWQREALQRWRLADRVGIVEAVTGTGKTRVGIAAVAEALADGKRALVVVPTVELQDQWFGQLASLLPRARVALLGGGQKPFGTWDVVVAVINTLAMPSSLALASACDLIVADECHRYGADGFAKALRSSHSRRLGLTATLERQDEGVGNHLLPYFGSLLMSYGYEEAVPAGVVAPFKVALVGVHLSAGERLTYDEISERVERGVLQVEPFTNPAKPFFPQVAELARQQTDVGLAAAGLVKAVSDRRGLLSAVEAKASAVTELAPAFVDARSLVFTERVATAQQAASGLAALGIRAGCVHSEMPQDERRDVLRRFAKGQVRVLCAPRVLDEGIDVPEADLAVVLSGTRTKRQMVQRMGRILRLKQDDREARFVVTYARGTVEDPAARAHEGFLTAIADVARDKRDFDVAAGFQPVLDYLGAFAPLPEVPAPAAPAGPIRGTQDRRRELREALAERQRARADNLLGRVKYAAPSADNHQVPGGVQ